MFNLLLRFDPFGRHVLSDDQRVATHWFSATLSLALAAGAGWLLTKNDLCLHAMLFLAALSVCVAAVFGCALKARRTIARITIALAVLAVVSLCLTALGYEERAETTTALFALSFIWIQLSVNFMLR